MRSFWGDHSTGRSGWIKRLGTCNFIFSLHVSILVWPTTLVKNVDQLVIFTCSNFKNFSCAKCPWFTTNPCESHISQIHIETNHPGHLCQKCQAGTMCKQNISRISPFQNSKKEKGGHFVCPVTIDCLHWTGPLNFNKLIFWGLEFGLTEWRALGFRHMFESILNL